MQPAISAAKPPPLHTAVASGSSPAAATRRKPLLAVSSQSCSHALKLRDSFFLGPHASLELGLDFHLDRGHLHLGEVLHGASPHAALQYQLDPEERHLGVLRVDPRHGGTLCFCRRFTLGHKGDWWRVPLDTRVALSPGGPPHVSVGVARLPLALGLAAALLIVGRPVHLAHKEVGGLALHFPITVGGHRHNECLQERVEVDATLRRAGRGLRLDLHQLNGVVRLREER